MQQNREIKFRAWDKFDGMLYTNKNLIIIPSAFNPLDFSYDHYGRITFYETKCKKWEKHITGHSGILMQYTGLKDKNGKEIYEGDIVNEEFWDGGDGINEPSNRDEFVGEVIWDKTGCSFGLKTEGCSENEIEVGLIQDGQFVKLEIIGNIMENPELLEEKNAT